MAEKTPPILPLSTRLWFAWVCFFRVVFDGAFASRAWAAGPGDAPRLPRSSDSALQPAPAPAAAPAALPGLAPTVAPEPIRALQLLSLLQREGRLVDFLQQEIATFSDADVGAAARVVHEGCRKALRAHASIEPIRSEAEGARVVLSEGFSPDEVKLTGNVGGPPPYAGVLRHRGWRATRLELPQIMAGYDARTLAAAEVELP